MVQPNKNKENNNYKREKFYPIHLNCKLCKSYLNPIFFLFQCMHILDRCDRLGLRKEEYILLKAIVVTNCDIQMDESLQLRKLKDDLLASLHDSVAVIR